ncbi:cytochrome P450 [Pseudomonas sp. MF5691]|uniref:cytochrome P450 n=1 Tax=unclassified Pseudomonas TaxID=196821 RepID=UPI0018E7BE19|nr:MULTISPECIES: cytochrome P450 [unclassified Pseudomonas]MBJ2293451.1 cytochrome P450 [Pseudomonas sp. MF5691]MBK3457336.1 cytochrome P450 [Pseudomonas sp. MF6754]
MTPLDAATYADPYPYYAQLRQASGLWFDPGLGLWVASRADTVAAILAHPACRVRPPGEPVPQAIAHGAAGQVFGRLMRMNDGARQQCPRQAIEPLLSAVTIEHIAQSVARAWGSTDDLNELMFSVPVSVMALLLGFAPSQLPEVARYTRDFVACLSPLSDAAQRRDADFAAVRLSQLFSGLLLQPGSLLKAIGRHNVDAETLIANLIGVLSQTCEATAGLIGNSLVALQRHPQRHEAICQAPALASAWVEEVARYDSPVQNTRRFVAERCVIGESVLEVGDIVLLLLASANRDPVGNPDPDSFLLERRSRRIFSFGSGKHQCPGQHLALSIASMVLQVVLARQPATLTRPFSYWPSLNSRIPKFHDVQETAP